MSLRVPLDTVRRRAFAAACALLLSACGGAPANAPNEPVVTPVQIAPIEKPPAPPPERTDLAIARPVDPGPACPAPTGPSQPELLARFDIARKLTSGQAADAVTLSERLIDASPADRGAVLLRDAARAAQVRAQTDVADAVDAMSAIALAPIPLAATHVADANVSGPPVTLTKESEKPNLVTDYEDYWQRNGVADPRGRGSLGAPDDVPVFQGKMGWPRWVFENGTHRVSYYERTKAMLVATAPGKAPRLFDLTAPLASGKRRFEVWYVALAGNALYVQFAFNGYSKDAGGKNGFVAAFDAERGTLLFSSDPLTGGMSTFTIVGGSLITGYGFTSEPSSLFVMDARSGKITQKIPLAHGPDSIVKKGDQLLVRAHDKDLVYKLSATDAPTPPSLAAGNVPPASSDADVCWLLAAASALDKNDAAAVTAASEQLARSMPKQDAAKAVAQLGADAKNARYDVVISAPTVLREPPWRSVTVKASRASGAVPHVARIGDAPPDLHAENEPGYGIERTRWSKMLAEKYGVPEDYGLAHLSEVNVGPDHMMLIYGGRYLAMLSGPRTRRVFDMDAFRHPPDPDPTWKKFSETDVTHAEVVGGVLYVCNGGGSYAKEVHGKKAFISALDPSSGELLWRSDPLVCGHDFVVVGGGIVTGYGFTDEPDFVYVIDRATGRTTQKVPIESAPNHFEMMASGGGRMLVETYAKRHVFQLK
jgi:hypothetical protein